MPQFLTIQQVKLNLRVDHDDEDSLIEELIDAAFDSFEHSTNRKLYAVGEPIPKNVKNGINITSSIIRGAHMLIGHWYANKESVALGTISTEVPLGTEYLWKRHRWANV